MTTGTYILTKCPKCNELTPISRFCKNCGKLNQNLYTEIETEICPHCGERVAKGNFCGVCGKSMKN